MFDGMFGFGFDSFEDVGTFMRELQEWQEVKLDPEKAKAFLQNASPRFKEGMLNSVHEGFLQSATLLMSCLRTTALMGMPEELVRKTLELLQDVHAWVDDASESVSNPPTEEKKPTLSPEEDRVSFSILDGVFGQHGLGGDWC